MVAKTDWELSINTYNIDEKYTDEHIRLQFSLLYTYWEFPTSTYNKD